MEWFAFYETEHQGYASGMVLQTVEGTFENGEIRLKGAPPEVEKARVLVTFLTQSGSIDLPAIGMEPAQAADLRARLASFAEDWDRPEMDAYDGL